LYSAQASSDSRKRFRFKYKAAAASRVMGITAAYHDEQLPRG
jgi:hypothetical protein